MTATMDGSSSALPSSSTLVAHLSAALSASPPPFAGSVSLQTLLSTPRQSTSLYSHAFSPAPAATTLAEGTANDDLDRYKQVWVEDVFVTASYAPQPVHPSSTSATSSDANALAGEPVLVFAIEANVYTVPSTRSALLYISKIDSSGHIPRHTATFRSEQPTPPSASARRRRKGESVSKALTIAFIDWFASFAHWRARHSPGDNSAPVDSLHVHLLARAQSAYLFPGSPDNPGKRVLTDTGLIKWWRAVLSEAISLQTRRMASTRDGADKREHSRGGAMRIYPFYLIPGYAALDSREVLPLPPSAVSATLQGTPPDPIIISSSCKAISAPEVPWYYGHAYQLFEQIPFPLVISTSTSTTDANTKGNADGPVRRNSLSPSIAHLIPHFPDDPKARFLDEIVRDAYEVGPLGATKGPGSLQQASTLVSARQGSPRPKGPDTEVKRAHMNGDAHEPDERDAKRRRMEQDSGLDASGKETTNGDASALPTSTRLRTDPSPMAETEMMTDRYFHERRALDKVTVSDFWERMGFRQECCSGRVVGFFQIVFTTRSSSPEAEAGATTPASSPASPPRPQPLSLPHVQMSSLIRNYIMGNNVDFETLKDATSVTARWEGKTRRVLARLAAGQANGGGSIASASSSRSCGTIVEGAHEGAQSASETTTSAGPDGAAADLSAVRNTVVLPEPPLEEETDVSAEVEPSAPTAPVVTTLQVKKKKKKPAPS